MSTFNNVFSEALRGRNVPSTTSQDRFEQNTARLARVETMMCEINSKLELILDTMTKPAAKAQAEAKAADNAEAIQLQLDNVVVASNDTHRVRPQHHMRDKMKKWIESHEGGMNLFRKRADAKHVTATLYCDPDTVRGYTHRMKLSDSLVGRQYCPRFCNLDEAREVAAYLQSLGVKVKTNGLI
jgi:hypothetical protein